MAFYKKHAIRDLESKDAAQDIDDNFDALFAAVKELKRQLGNAIVIDEGGGTGLASKGGIPGTMGEDGQDGAPGPPGPRGPAGVAGAAGATGAQGPRTLGPMSLLPEEPDIPFMIPGPRGPQGATGADGGGGYTLVDTGTPSTVEYIVTGLDAYSEIIIMGVGITKTVSTTSSIRVSNDGGSTWFSSSGDYVGIAASGAETNATAIVANATNASAARGWIVYIYGFNLSGAPKVAWTTNVGAVTANSRIATTTVLDAIRIFNTSETGVMNGGTIYVLGR